MELIKCYYFSVMPNNPVLRSLEEEKPDWIDWWHPTKNGDKTPFEKYKSTTKIWLKCPEGDDHEFSINLNEVSKKKGCSVCLQYIIVPSTCLDTLNPDLASQWHPSQNGELTPKQVGIHSNKRIWWKCEKGDDHIWKTSVTARTRGTGCPYCSGLRPSKGYNLEDSNPEVASEWHPTKNGEKKPVEFTPMSGHKVWWLCSKNKKHEWETPIAKRTTPKEKNGCPYCCGILFFREDSFAGRNPHLIKEWHPTKNGKKDPFTISNKASYSAWWKCDKAEDHVWQTLVRHRVEGSGCPFCAGQRTDSKTNIAYLSPKFFQEWHPTKNTLDPTKIGVSYDKKKSWWLCKNCGYEWEATNNNRSKGKGCPMCDLTPQSKQELTITFELKTIFENIDPKGFKTRLNGRLRSIDIFLPSIDLAIEFDGSYWHKNKQQMDKMKSQMLNEKGLSVIRIRQHPLKKLTQNDIISNEPFDGKRVTDDLLKKILEIYDLDQDTKIKISKYISLQGLQNENKLEEYIDYILSKKAGKSSGSYRSKKNK